MALVVSTEKIFLREGFYSFEHANGSFPIQIRRFGSFYCEKFPANGSWKVSLDANNAMNMMVSLL